jgi:RNA-directed DNA polymerase
VKRQRVELADIAERGNLTLATFKAAQGKHHRPPVQRFLSRLDIELATLSRNVLQGRAPLGRAVRFQIHDPKPRQIVAACFEDRVLHHAVLNLTEARFEQSLADSAYACRQGRGVHAAVAAVQRGLQRHAWLVQVDIAQCFASLRHDLVLAWLARRFKGEGFLALMARIVATGQGPSAVPGRGLPIGALTSQHLANGTLGACDRWLEAQRDVRSLVRYMDDIVWFCESRAAAQATLAGLRALVENELDLRLKDRVLLRRTSQGLLFCGFRVRPGVVLASPRKRRRYEAAVQRLVRAEVQGHAERDLQRAADVARAALHPAQSLRLRQAAWARHARQPAIAPLA